MKTHQHNLANPTRGTKPNCKKVMCQTASIIKTETNLKNYKSIFLLMAYEPNANTDRFTDELPLHKTQQASQPFRS